MISALPEVLNVIFLPFFGTVTGAACVFFMKKAPGQILQKALNGFAAGVMIAASVWSLLLPAIEQTASWEKLSFIPAVAGFWIGILFLLFFDRAISRLFREDQHRTDTKKNMILFTAVTLHNFPEGIAVGIVLAAWLAGNKAISIAEVLAVSIGIAIQNFPEGAIISMPFMGEGKKKRSAFLYGMLSGVVEPVAAFITLLISALLTALLPYLLSFAAGAMMYVVANELIPEMQEKKRSYVGIMLFTFGFTLMMALDVALG